MRHSAIRNLALAAVSALAVLAGRAYGGVITQWSFTSTVAAPDNSPSPTTGNGALTSLGMTNSYTYANGEGPGSTTSDDIAQPGGTRATEFGWRIRGNSNSKNSGPGKANGWNNSAPNYTQGIQANVDTTGFTDIGVSFDWFCTSAGVGNLQPQYTIDGTDYINIGPDLVAKSNDWYGGANQPDVTLDLSGIAGVSNDPTFGIRLVSVQPVSTDSNFASTNGDGNYASAAGGDYNNNSGNWSFNNITITGTAVPEPTSAGLLAIGALGLIRRRRASR